ncbi:hypothetical protein M758_12G179000 [Ceratodon purpureus]|nr:hypothetical protein M758_12G179000 [Ceratodon purpureus]
MSKIAVYNHVHLMRYRATQQQTQVFSMSHFHANFPGRGRLQRDGELGLPVPASYEGREKTGDSSVFDVNPPDFFSFCISHFR